MSSSQPLASNLGQEVNLTATTARQSTKSLRAPTSDAYDDHAGPSAAAAATASTGGVAQDSRRTVRYDLPGVDIDDEIMYTESSYDSNSLASDSENDGPHFNFDMDISLPPPAPSIQTWSNQESPLLTDYTTRQVKPPSGNRVHLKTVVILKNDPMKAVLGAMQELNRENIADVDSSNVVPSQLLENYVDMPELAKEYFRCRFKHVNLDNRVAVLLTVIVNNIYDSHIRLMDTISQRAIENMDLRNGSQLDVADFAFEVDFEMSHELPVLAGFNSRVRETLESMRPKDPSKTPKPKPSPTKQPPKKKAKTATTAAAESSRMAAARQVRGNAGGASAVRTNSRSTPRGQARGRATIVTGRGRGRRGAAASRASAPNSTVGPSVDPSIIVNTLAIKAEAAAGNLIFTGSSLAVNNTTQDRSTLVSNAVAGPSVLSRPQFVAGPSGLFASSVTSTSNSAALPVAANNRFPISMARPSVPVSPNRPQTRSIARATMGSSNPDNPDIDMASTSASSLNTPMTAAEGTNNRFMLTSDVDWD